MSNFENIVRPFQSPQVSYPTRIFDDTTAAAENPVLELGKEGSSKVFQESYSASNTTYKDQKSKELSRETEKKRIENPDDPAQYVDVENIKKLVLEQGKGSKYQKVEHEFKNT